MITDKVPDGTLTETTTLTLPVSPPKLSIPEESFTQTNFTTDPPNIAGPSMPLSPRPPQSSSSSTDSNSSSEENEESEDSDNDSPTGYDMHSTQNHTTLTTRDSSVYSIDANRHSNASSSTSGQPSYRTAVEKRLWKYLPIAVIYFINTYYWRFMNEDGHPGQHHPIGEIGETTYEIAVPIAAMTFAMDFLHEMGQGIMESYRVNPRRGLRAHMLVALEIYNDKKKYVDSVLLSGKFFLGTLGFTVAESFANARFETDSTLDVGIRSLSAGTGGTVGVELAAVFANLTNGILDRETSSIPDLLHLGFAIFLGDFWWQLSSEVPISNLALSAAFVAFYAATTFLLAPFISEALARLSCQTPSVATPDKIREVNEASSSEDSHNDDLEQGMSLEQQATEQTPLLPQTTAMARQGVFNASTKTSVNADDDEPELRGRCDWLSSWVPAWISHRF